MYICLCRAVTDQQIQQAVDEGVRSMEELQEQLEVSTCCGICAEDANACLQEHMEREAVPA